ncbi:hypothetical protein RB195_022718 [Necator americanus]|uniref:Uncharacterized protein n=1 Tax=Necator americanus TaxID=51031 RepID=A0ABR1EGJ2_NECAM
MSDVSNSFSARETLPEDEPPLCIAVRCPESPSGHYEAVNRCGSCTFYMLKSVVTAVGLDVKFPRRSSGANLGVKLINNDLVEASNGKFLDTSYRLFNEQKVHKAMVDCVTNEVFRSALGPKTCSPARMAKSRQVAVSAPFFNQASPSRCSQNLLPGVVVQHTVQVTELTDEFDRLSIHPDPRTRSRREPHLFALIKAYT